MRETGLTKHCMSFHVRVANNLRCPEIISYSPFSKGLVRHLVTFLFVQNAEFGENGHKTLNIIEKSSTIYYI